MSSNSSEMQIRFYRNRDGLSVNVQTSERIEQFFKNLKPEAKPEPAGIFGRYWVPTLHQDLSVYSMGTASLGGVFGTDNPKEKDDNRGLLARMQNPTLSRRFRLDRPGGPLEERGVINLSMLRLVGTSKGNGVTFLYPGVYDDKRIALVAELVQKCSVDFYNTFLREMDITIRIIREAEENEEAGPRLGN